MRWTPAPRARQRCSPGDGPFSPGSRRETKTFPFQTQGADVARRLSLQIERPLSASKHETVPSKVET